MWRGREFVQASQSLFVRRGYGFIYECYDTIGPQLFAKTCQAVATQGSNSSACFKLFQLPSLAGLLPPQAPHFPFHLRLQRRAVLRHRHGLALRHS